jgi:hypothetical protein
VNEPNASAIGLFVAACLVYLAVATTYLTSLAGVNNDGSIMLQGNSHAGDVVAANLEAIVVP